MLAKEPKSSSLVKSATRFLRHELRKIFIGHQKKKTYRGGAVSFRQKVHSEGTDEM